MRYVLSAAVFGVSFTPGVIIFLDKQPHISVPILFCHYFLATVLDGVHKPPHGKNFKKWAAISMRKIRDVEVTTTHDYQIVYKYAWVSISFSALVPSLVFY